MLRVGVNGMGRIGRLFTRAAFQHPEYGRSFEIVAFNDLADNKTTAFLLKQQDHRLPPEVRLRSPEMGSEDRGDREGHLDRRP